MPLTHPEEASVSSPAEQAQTAYLEAVRQILGVLRLAICGGDTAAEQWILVCLPALRSETADQVIDAEGEVRHRYPGSGLDVQVKALKERHLRTDQVDELLPTNARVLL